MIVTVRDPQALAVRNLVDNVAVDPMSLEETALAVKMATMDSQIANVSIMRKWCAQYLVIFLNM